MTSHSERVAKVRAYFEKNKLFSLVVVVIAIVIIGNFIMNGITAIKEKDKPTSYASEEVVENTEKSADTSSLFGAVLFRLQQAESADQPARGIDAAAGGLDAGGSAAAAAGTARRTGPRQCFLRTRTAAAAGKDPAPAAAGLEFSG